MAGFSLKCGDCGTLLKSVEEAQEHAELTKHANFTNLPNIVFASIQSYQNVPIIGYIKEKFGADEMLSWVQRHIKHGFAALEKLLEKHAGKYATGDEVFLADLYLAPQLDAAIIRFDVEMIEFPILSKINEAYKEHPAFRPAMPRKQPDTPPEHRD